ncbi:MAG: quinolinate synthase NadA [Deltaproteobacteria bacterium]|nr:quinolinate synthase NadA [Deltaproteobacteria bacterium]
MNKTSDKEKIIKKILDLKNHYGKKLIILTHHYQRKEIIDAGDYRGDSFGLSQTAAKDSDAEYIVFCGVHFMAESAAILAKPGQTVQIPDMNAGCWMADMADSVKVDKAWNEVAEITGKNIVTPLVYMNSDAYIKAHCGRNNGVVCTSSNAPLAFKWAFNRREKIFFFPDEHLGRNTANRLGIPSGEMILWNPDKPLGGNTEDDINNARVILWEGHCLVHTRFTVDMMNRKRAEFPEARIVVHPECTEDVVNLSDAVGSTSFIVNYAKEAPEGSTIIIGTEINLIERLKIEYPGKNIMPLRNSLCPNMYKINLENLLQTLEHIGQTNIVTIEKEIAKDAVIALNNMLSLS